MFLRLRYRYTLPLSVTVANLCAFFISIMLPPDPTKWSLVFKAELVLNLPAVFLSIPAGFFPLWGSNDASVIGLTILLAPFLWYWVGKWIDRQLGTLEQKPDRVRSRVPRTILRFFAYGYLLLSALALTPLNPTPSSDSHFFFSTMAIWLVGYLVCSYWGGTRSVRILSN